MEIVPFFCSMQCTVATNSAATFKAILAMAKKSR